MDRRTVLLGGLASAALGSTQRAGATLLPAARRTETFDVVMIGSGMAGLCAAIEAASAGARVVILEKMPATRSGGNSRIAGGLITVPAGATAAAKSEFVEDLNKKTMGRGNAVLFQVLADRALDDVAWLKQQGAELLAPTPFAPYRVHAIQVAPAQFAGMPKLMDTLNARVATRGGTIVYDTKAAQLVVDDRARVAGVRAVDADGVTEYRGKAVVLATGGYAANKAILETFVDPNAGGMVVRGVPWATGDGLLMAREAGAGLASMGGLTSLHVAAVSSLNPTSGIPDRGLPFCISVNQEGKRFEDEAHGYVANGKAALKQPRQTVAFVFDEEIRKEERVKTSIGVFERLGLPIIAADTIEELAQKMNMPPAALAATIADFNNAVRDGKALGATPPKGEFARRIETPKFYAFHPLVPGVTMTFGGLMIDAEARVLEPDGRVIRGLYAAGEVAGGEFYDDYVGGCMLTKCLVMGRIAGRLAAQAA